MMAAPTYSSVPSRGGLPAYLTAAATAIILLMLGLILGLSLIHGAGSISLGFLAGEPDSGLTSGGVFPAIFGTVAMVLLMTIFTVPIGVTTAVYLHEYAPRKSFSARLIRLAIYNLAGVPTIVFGLFGLSFFVGFVGGGIDSTFYNSDVPVWGQPAIIWSALTVALLTLPVVIVSAEESLGSIPDSLRQASLALGATKLQTIHRVVIPQAAPGILTGVILAVSRGAGAVAPIMFTGVAFYLPNLPQGLTDRFMSLGFYVYTMATQSHDLVPALPMLYGMVLILLVLTFMLNAVALLIRTRMRTQNSERT